MHNSSASSLCFFKASSLQYHQMNEPVWKVVTSQASSAVTFTQFKRHAIFIAHILTRDSRKKA